MTMRMSAIQARVVLGTALVVAAAACTDSVSPLLKHSDRTASVGGGVAMVVTSGTATLNVGDNLQLSAALVNPAGHTVPSNRPIVWASSNASVCTVSATGLVTAVGAGTATITASGGGASGSAVITVSNANLDSDGDGVPDSGDACPIDPLCQ